MKLDVLGENQYKYLTISKMSFQKGTCLLISNLPLLVIKSPPSGSEINFLIWAPTGEQVKIFGRQGADYGRQKFPLAAWKRSTRIDHSCCGGIFTGRFVSLLN